MQSNSDSADVVPQNQIDALDMNRRSFMSSSFFAATIGTSSFMTPALAKADDSDSMLESYQDKDCGFKVSVPKTWEKSVQELSDRRKIVFFVDPTTKSSPQDKNLIFIAYTPIRDDFTNLSSFGSVDQVAQMTILPKGQLANVDDNESRMLSAESKKNAYYFDYTIKAENQPKTHFRTIFALAAGATGGAGSVLVTLTAQVPESKYDEMKPTFDAIVNSYGKL